jgi:cytochrome o ubiquinol oxidase subunit II
VSSLRSLAVVVAAAAALGGCTPSISDPAGPIGAADNTIMLDSLAIMLAIIVPTIIATFGFAWWYRASNGRALYRPDWDYSGQVEMVVWGIPLLVIVLLGGVAWIGSHRLDPAQPIASSKDPIEIEAVSLDWKWLFIYPHEGVATLNKLIVPVGVPLHFSLTSASVMNVFFVPNLGTMIYTMNGMATQLNLQADKTGVFYGRSAHFSGDGFPGMEFNVDVVEAKDFSDWVTKAKSSNEVLDEASYRQLLKQSSDVAPATFKLADAMLYSDIVSQKLPPGPGPQYGRPTPQVSPRSGDKHVR